MTRVALPRSQTIQKSWSNLDWPSVFAAIIYPLLGVFGIVGAIVAGLALESLVFAWWFIPAAMLVGAMTLVICNLGIGVLHRIWQHKAGELKWPAQVLTIVHCLVAMQGQLKDWVNYHSQHHRLSDKPGDPHNPHESKFWAWIGWLLWRDENDLKRPLAMWLRDIPGVRFVDRHYSLMSLLIHLVIPAAIYTIVALAGGSILLTVLLHASAVTARGLQFHATTLGVNVVGHLKAPAWVNWLLALLTGGEAIHGHHHDYPASALHLPRKGLINRIVDYNGTALLIFEKLRWAKNLQIAPMFAEPARVKARAD